MPSFRTLLDIGDEVRRQLEAETAADEVSRLPEARIRAIPAPGVGCTSEEDLIEDRLADWDAELKPIGGYQRWFAGQIAAATVRIDDCRRRADAWRLRQSRRAAACWEIDRRVDIERLGEGLARRPGRVAAQLRQSRLGCEWLLSRWRVLAEVVRGLAPEGSPRPLDEDNRRLALDLLGHAPERRQGPTPLDPLPDAPSIAAATHQASLIAAEIAALESLMDGPLATLDALDREDTERGLANDQMLRQIRREEAIAQRQLREATQELRRIQSVPSEGPPCESNDDPWHDLAPVLSPLAGAAVAPEPLPPSLVPSFPTPVSGRPHSLASAFAPPPPRNRHERRAAHRS